MKVGGEPVSRGEMLLAFTVTAAANRVASARLVYQDGAASRGFPLSNAGTFAPGSEVEILAGPLNDPTSLFRGIVVRQAIKVRERGASQLVVDCRHAAFKLTVGRKNACFFDKKDSEVFSALIEAAGLSAEVEGTSVVHPQLVQYRSTDWDFLVSRAEANGRFVVTDGDKIIVKSPAASGAPVLSLVFGATILELDAAIDARTQFSAVKSVTWDAAEQALVECEAADPGIEGPGNTSAGALADVAGLSSYDLVHSSLDKAEAQAWADAEWKRSRVNKVSGSVKCIGIASVRVGDVVRLSDVGERYDGEVLVTAVRHDASPGEGWRTHLQFGGVEPFAAEARAISAPPAAALLPAARGLCVGTVVSNEDPSGEARVRVSLPLVGDCGDGIFARVASLDAGEERGFFFRPEKGDEVVVGFFDDDPRRPVILGMLHSSAKAPPLVGSDDNHEKGYQSRSKMRIYFNDEKKVLLLETPGGNKITLSEEKKGISIEDQNGNVVALSEDGVMIESAKDLSIKAASKITIDAGEALSIVAGTEGSVEAGTSLAVKAGTEGTIEAGTSLGVKGGTEIKLEGASGAELSSSAETKVKGSKVKLGS